MIYSNARLEAVIEDWPLGRDKRGPATFRIEQNSKGERAIRTMTGASKMLAYTSKARIVDGDDGRTYIANWNRNYGLIVITRGDMKLQQEVIHEDNPRYQQVLALMELCDCGVGDESQGLHSMLCATKGFTKEAIAAWNKEQSK